MNPTETYVRLMDEVEDNVAEAHRQQFNHHELLDAYSTTWTVGTGSFYR